MGTEQGGKSAELEPAYIKFPVCGIVYAIRIIAPGKETADIRIPVGNAGKRDAQAAGNLVVQDLPLGFDIAGPNCRTIALLTCKGGPGKDENPFVPGAFPLMTVYPTGSRQWEGIVEAPEAARALLAVIDAVMIIQFGFVRVHPPAVYPQGEKMLVQIRPVDIARNG